MEIKVDVRDLEWGLGLILEFNNGKPKGSIAIDLSIDEATEVIRQLGNTLANHFRLHQLTNEELTKKINSIESVSIPSVIEATNLIVEPKKKRGRKKKVEEPTLPTPTSDGTSKGLGDFKTSYIK